MVRYAYTSVVDLNRDDNHCSGEPDASDPSGFRLVRITEDLPRAVCPLVATLTSCGSARRNADDGRSISACGYGAWTVWVARSEAERDALAYGVAVFRV